MDEVDIWAVWKRIVRELPVWRMPYEWFFSPSLYTLFGVDFISGLRRNRSTGRVQAHLRPLPPRELRRIYAMAHLNHRRQEVVSRWFAIGFLTLPASAALTLSQLAPDVLQVVAEASGLTRWYLMLTYAAVVVGYYLMCAWRARQLLTLVELAFIERAVPLHGADELDDSADPIANPLGT